MGLTGGCVGARLVDQCAAWAQLNSMLYALSAIWPAWVIAGLTETWAIVLLGASGSEDRGSVAEPRGTFLHPCVAPISPGRSTAA